MNESAIHVLNELWSAPNKCVDIRTHVDHEGNSAAQAFWTHYDQAIQEVRSAWGEPEYQGVGPRWGYKGPAPCTGLDSYESAVQIAWWRTAGGVAAVMVTGHDADTLLILQLAVCPTN